MSNNRAPLRYPFLFIILTSILLWALIILGVRYAFAEPVLAPFAHTQFCLKHPAQCRAAPGHIGTAAELRRINVSVNMEITADASLIDAPWTISPPRGVCHDYAITKQAKLLRAGWPSSALRLAEVITPSKEHHLILQVDANGNEVILDNLTDAILPRARSQYTFFKVQNQDNPAFWSTP